MRFIVGLGNPGRRYRDTRHNAGFLVVDELARRWGIDCGRRQLGCLVGAGSISGGKVMLVKPRSFMNRSGHPVRSLLGFYKAGPAELVVVHDDIDLPAGAVRLKSGGGSGGHNGLRDIDRHLGDPGYTRVRLGVGRPPPGWDAADYVLARLGQPELASMDVQVSLAADAVQAILAGGLVDAMNRFNVRDRKGGAGDPTSLSLDLSPGRSPNPPPPASLPPRDPLPGSCLVPGGLAAVLGV